MDEAGALESIQHGSQLHFTWQGVAGALEVKIGWTEGEVRLELDDDEAAKVPCSKEQSAKDLQWSGQEPLLL